MVRGQMPEDFRFETLSADVDLRCSLSQARAGLADRAVWRFPGMPACARKSNGSSVQQELDLPVLGRRTQTVMISSEVKRGPKGVTKVAFSSRGELLSVSGSWTIARGKRQVNAALTVGYTASGALMEGTPFPSSIRRWAGSGSRSATTSASRSPRASSASKGRICS